MTSVKVKEPPEGLLLGEVYHGDGAGLIVSACFPNFLELFKLNTDGYADFAGVAAVKVFYLKNPVFFKTKLLHKIR